MTIKPDFIKITESGTDISLVSESVLQEVYEGLWDGVNFVRKKYNVVENPTVVIGNNEGTFSGINGYGDSNIGKIISLQISEVLKLANIDDPAVVTITQDYGKDIPIKPRTTIRQWYESFGIEETVHWLQDKKVLGLVELPQLMLPINNGNGNGVPYQMQPHEFQALQIKNEYFIKKYKKSPFQQLERFIKKKYQNQQ